MISHVPLFDGALSTGDEFDWIEPLEASSADDSLASRFSSAMGKYRSGVSVLTCDDLQQGVHGMNVEHLMFVSRTPPTIAVSLKAGRANRLISRQSRFGVSLLREQQANYPRYFEKSDQAGVNVKFEHRRIAPTLSVCLAWFECALIQRVQVHDHTLFIAEVTHCGASLGEPLL